MKYLKKFQTNADYQTFKGGSNWVKPNLSAIEEDNGLFYNGIRNDNYIQVNVINPYAPDGAGDNCPRITAICDYPVETDITITGTCVVRDASATQDEVNFSITILQHSDNGTDLIESDDLNISPTYPYTIININKCTCNVQSDSVYKYRLILP